MKKFKDGIVKIVGIIIAVVVLGYVVLMLTK